MMAKSFLVAVLHVLAAAADTAPQRGRSAWSYTTSGSVEGRSFVFENIKTRPTPLVTTCLLCRTLRPAVLNAADGGPIVFAADYSGAVGNHDMK